MYATPTSLARMDGVAFQDQPAKLCPHQHVACRRDPFVDGVGNNIDC